MTDGGETLYHVEIEASAAKALSKIDQPWRRRITDAIQSLAADPRPSGVTKLTGTDACRIRVGAHRIVYLVADSVRVVTITRIAHRRNVYQGM